MTLNDTTVIFLDRKASISSSAVEALLNSTLLTFRYRGIGKLTAQNSWEYFDYGLARLPIKVPESSREKGLCTRLHKLATVAHGSRRERSELVSEIDEVVYEYYDITLDERRLIDSELEWSSFAAVEAEEITETSGEV